MKSVQTVVNIKCDKLAGNTMMTSQARWRLTILSFFCYMLTGGLIVLTGMIIKPLAAFFSIDIAEAGGVFTWMNLGILIAILSNSFLMEIIPLKRQIFIGAGIIVAIFIGLIFVKSMYIFCFLMFFFGLVSGIAMSVGTYLISCMYEGKIRGTMLLLTDSFFSLAGITFPLIAGLMLNKEMPWYTVYIMVLVCGIGAFLFSLGVCFPSPSQIQQAEKNQPLTRRLAEEIKQWGIAVYLLFAGCTLYILGQLCLVFWIPTYVENVFNATPEVAAEPLSFFWIGMWLGLYASSLIVKRFPIYLFVTLISIGATVMFFVLRQAQAVDTLKFQCLAMGLFSSGIYYSFITLTSLQTKKPSPLLINMALTFGTVGTFLTPIVTARAVNMGGPGTALLVGNFCYLLVFLVAFVVMFTTKHKQYAV